MSKGPGKRGMKYKNGVWTVNSPLDMDTFFYSREDGRTLPPEPEPIYAPDHTDALWDRRFQVETSIVATKSVETLARVGLLVTGIKKVDAVAHERLIYPYLTIDDIIEIENNGFDVNYLSLKSLVDIYGCVSEYLEFWTQQMLIVNQDVHSYTHYPLDDLDRIESYMHSIFPLVEKSVTKPVKSWASLMGRFMPLSEATPKIVEQNASALDSPVAPNMGLPNTLGEA